MAKKKKVPRPVGTIRKPARKGEVRQRRPMPKPSRPISTKKGVKGYDRKKVKRKFAKEVEEELPISKGSGTISKGSGTISKGSGTRNESRIFKCLTPILFKCLTPILLISLLFVIGCGQRTFKRSELLMGTLVEVTVVNRDQAQANRAIEHAFQEMARIEKLLSIYQKDSPIATINRLAGERAVKVEGEVFRVLKEAIEYGKKTSGAFDITIGPLVNLWDFTEGQVPSKEEIARKLPLVDYRDIVLDEECVKFGMSGMAIDLGGIAKGYAVDRAIEALKAEGISEAMVNAGGDIKVIGRRWRIGIQHHRGSDSVLGVLELADEAVATSGDYQRYFIEEGVRYHHIIDPRTGYPAWGCVSVTIVAREASLADTLATGCFVLGPKLGMELIKSLPDVEGIVVTSEGEILTSPGMANRISLIANR